jgi:hypothetical protein
MSALLATIPQPPVHSAMPKTAETVFNIFIFIPLGIALAIAIRHLTKGKGPILLYCLVGGALAATFEPIVDVLGLVFLKERGALGTFTILGRTVPLYICFVYPWYVGGLGYLAYKLFQRGITVRLMFQLWLLDCVVDVFLETPGLLLHTYTYYGKQPLEILGFPLWWGFINPVMPMLAGALIYRLRPQLTSPWKLLAIIPIIPIADGVGNAAAGFPMWIALNQNHSSYLWTYIASAVTLGLALYAVWIISLAVARPAEELADETLLQKLKALVVSPGDESPRATGRPAGARVGSIG